MQTDNNQRLTLSFDRDLWGKNRAHYAAALSQEQASAAELQVARNALIGAVVQSYFNLQNALAQKSVIDQIVKQQEDVLAITRQRVTAGPDTEVEIGRASCRERVCQ